MCIIVVDVEVFALVLFRYLACLLAILEFPISFAVAFVWVASVPELYSV